MARFVPPLYRPTVARDLTAGLVATLFVVFGLAGAVNYLYAVERDTSALYEKAAEIMSNLATVLATPLWNLNTEELRKIVDLYRQSGIVVDIVVEDDKGQALVPARASPLPTFLEMTRAIHHDRQPIGHVTVSFTDAGMTARRRETLTYTGVLFAVLALALTAATRLLLLRFLKGPLERLKNGLAVIEAGDYGHAFTRARQDDINEIIGKVTGMAREIAKREAVLVDNRGKLEVLNQAILDLFACADAPSLARTVLRLAHRVCGARTGVFLPAAGATPDRSPLAPLAADGAVVTAATEGAVRAHLERVEGAPGRASFPLAAGPRLLGTLTFDLQGAADGGDAALLRSLASLAGLALTRQTLIREAAVVDAELAVAETIQRSMLVDETKTARAARLAWHYQPVLGVGGDWFSILEAKGGDCLYVLLGDVTGHGLAQGLITTAMAGATTALESLIAEGGIAPSPSSLVAHLNAVVAQLAGRSNLRMTCVAAKLDFVAREVTVCNAGHTFPLRIHHGDGERPRVESLARFQQPMLGDQPTKATRFLDAVYPLDPSDILVFYTDGLTEAVDEQGKTFLRTFHRHFVRQLQRRTVEEVLADVLALFAAHTSGAPVKDDVCLVVVGRREDAEANAA
jgi:serine phosphatase RsbU (regulator of sigma subunit)/HAMP domain-containing protein